MSDSSISGLSSGVDYSSLFSSLSSSNSSSDSGTTLLTDWASIKNGSYYKLSKAYYAGNDSNASALNKDELTSLIKSNSMLKTDASKLKDNLSAISDSKSLFTNKVTKKDADGNETTDYDYDKIVSSLKSFVESYNETIQSGGDSDNTTVLRNTLQMTRLTSVNENLLKQVGITVGEDNKLSINEEEVKKANITDLKSLFSGKGSYADVLESNATNIVNAVTAENNRLGGYNASGAYNTSGTVGSIYDDSL